jgi:hypothetical protein
MTKMPFHPDNLKVFRVGPNGRLTLTEAELERQAALSAEERFAELVNRPAIITDDDDED